MEISIYNLSKFTHMERMFFLGREIVKLSDVARREGILSLIDYADEYEAAASCEKTMWFMNYLLQQVLCGRDCSFIRLNAERMIDHSWIDSRNLDEYEMITEGLLHIQCGENSAIIIEMMEGFMGMQNCKKFLDYIQEGRPEIPVKVKESPAESGGSDGVITQAEIDELLAMPTKSDDHSDEV